MPATSTTMTAFEQSEAVAAPVEFDWSSAPAGTQMAVTGAPAHWEKLHYRDGDSILTASVGIMTQHEAMATRALRDGTWQTIAYGPLVIAVKIEK